MSERGFAVIGLGYVGLPVALALAKRFEPVVGLRYRRAADRRVRDAKDTHARGRRRRAPRQRRESFASPIEPDARQYQLLHRHRADADRRRAPARSHTDQNACDADRSKVLTPGAVVVFEFDGLSRPDRASVCGPLLAAELGAAAGRRFQAWLFAGDGSIRAIGSTASRPSPKSSPARMRRRWSEWPPVYGRDRRGRRSSRPSLEVAEAAKVIENTQRDLNIALMNELAIIFDRLGIPTRTCSWPRGTKWNFLPFTPGPGRRPLHRRRSLLPDCESRGGRLLPAGDPVRPADQ